MREFVHARSSKSLQRPNEHSRTFQDVLESWRVRTGGSFSPFCACPRTSTAAASRAFASAAAGCGLNKLTRILPARPRRTGHRATSCHSLSLSKAKALFKQFEDENFLRVTSNMSEGCREEFLETNKKINYIVSQETVRQIY